MYHRLRVTLFCARNDCFVRRMHRSIHRPTVARRTEAVWWGDWITHGHHSERYIDVSVSPTASLRMRNILSHVGVLVVCALHSVVVYAPDANINCSSVEYKSVHFRSFFLLTFSCSLQYYRRTHRLLPCRLTTWSTSS